MTLLMILVGVEERPRFLVDSLHELEAARLADWLRTSTALEEAVVVLTALLEELRRSEPEEAA
jgi:hypothetical protein